MIRLGIFAKTFVRPSLEATLDAVASHGLSCVQFNMACVGLPTLPEAIEPALAAEVADAFRARGLEMAAVSGTFNMIDPDRARRRRRPASARRAGLGLPGDGDLDHHALHRHARPR